MTWSRYATNDRRSRRVARGAWMSALALLAVLPLSPDASAAVSAEPIVTIGSTTVIKGSQSGRVTVRVPQHATLDLGFASGDVKALVTEGAGRLVGFVLQPAEPDRWFDAPHYFAARIPKTIGPFREVSIGVNGWTPACYDCPVPPGLYDLYLLADGGPVTVSLTFAGLDRNSTVEVGDGEDSAAPLTATTSVTDVPQPYTQLDGGGAARRRTSAVSADVSDAASHIVTFNATYGSGESDTLPNPPHPVVGGPVAVVGQGLCEYGGTVPAEDVKPDCLGGSSYMGPSVVRVFTPYAYFSFAVVFDHVPMRGTLAAYQDSAGTVDEFGHWAMFLGAVGPAPTPNVSHASTEW